MQVLSRLQYSLGLIEPSRFVADLRNRMRTRLHRLRMAMQRRMQSCERRVYETENRLVRISPEKTLRLSEQRLQSVGMRLRSGAAVMLEQCSRQLDSLDRQLQSVSYRRTLARGFSVTRSTGTGKLVASAAEVRPGDVLETEIADGRFQSTVNGIRKEQLKLFQ
jgi:exodeoxyribonuclease VII large subunit